jgi:hypothetical protein
MLIFLLIIGIAIVITKPKLGFDSGIINIINTQRGEHITDGVISKLLHNKLDVINIFIYNFDKLLSPVAIFANGFWHHINTYYPLGNLFPWDVYFLYIFFTKSKWKNNLYFYLSILVLLVLSSILNIDQGMIFSGGVIYFLAILISKGYSLVSKKITYFVLSIDFIFILIQFVITGYFKT